MRLIADPLTADGIENTEENLARKGQDCSTKGPMGKRRPQRDRLAHKAASRWADLLRISLRERGCDALPT